MEKFNDLIEKIENLTVVELAELVKALEEKFGITAAMPMASGSSQGGGAPQGGEKTSFDLILKAGGDQKINVIKIIKEVTGLGLKESKDLVDGAPKTIKQGFKKEEAEELKKKFEAVGATVEIQ